MPRIKLLYLVGDLGYGGAERHLIHVLKRLDRSKYEPFVACMKKEGQRIPEVERLNIPIIDLGIKKIYDLNGIRKLFFLSSFIKENKIDILQSYVYGANIVGAISAKIVGIPAIISNRSMCSFISNRRMLLRKTANRLATLITAVSEEVKRSDMKQGIPSNKIVTIYNGVEIQEVKASFDDIEAGKLELGLNPDHAVIGTVGNMRFIKGHQYLIQAVAKVVSVIPKVQFLIVGYPVGGGIFAEELKNLIEELNLKGRVILAGPRLDVPAVLSIIDLFVLPSLAEGMSNALLEAMAAGLPCVATNVGGNPEVVQDGVTGFLVPPKDPEKLADAILKLLLDKELAGKMGKNGKHRVMTNFTIDKMVSQLEQLYDHVMLLKQRVT